jgi:hypothetical protein
VKLGLRTHVTLGAETGLDVLGMCYCVPFSFNGAMFWLSGIFFKALLEKKLNLSTVIID